MTGPQITPGPWTLGSPDGGHNISDVYGPNGTVCAVYGLPLHTGRDEMDEGRAFSGKFAEGWANGQAIAAVPAMIEALIDFRNSLLCPVGPRPSDEELIDKAENALRQAGVEL